MEIHRHGAMKTYDLCLSPFFRLFPLALLTVFTVGVPVLIVSQGAPGFVAILWLGVVAWQWYVLLTLAYRIVLHEDGSMEWVALVRRVRMRPEDVREIGPDMAGQIGFFKVGYTGGKVRFINQITGFHEVLLHIKGRQPAVIIKGC